ncbi:MAG: nucleotidyl transferase AbiEii/AbiGii toxin family protein [Bacteroidota bacterium]
MPTKHLELLQTVASGLSDLTRQTIFVGGAVLDLYITDLAAPEYRPTSDIDCMLHIPALLDMFQWEQLLSDRGFEKVGVAGQPSPHWKYQGIPLTISPMQWQIELMGFQNRWYEEGVFHARPYSLSNGHSIRLFPPAYYVAAKIDAFQNRGKEDFRRSEDFQDLVFLIENRPELPSEIERAFHEVRTYIRTQFRRFLAYPELEEGLYYALPFGADEEHIDKIQNIMREIAAGEQMLV